MDCARVLLESSAYCRWNKLSLGLDALASDYEVNRTKNEFMLRSQPKLMEADFEKSQLFTSHAAKENKSNCTLLKICWFFSPRFQNKLFSFGVCASEDFSILQQFKEKTPEQTQKIKLNQVDIIVNVFGGGSSIDIACLSKLNTSTYKFYKLKIAYSFRPVAQQNSDLDSFYTSMLDIVL